MVIEDSWQELRHFIGRQVRLWGWMGSLVKTFFIDIMSHRDDTRMCDVIIAV